MLDGWELLVIRSVIDIAPLRALNKQIGVQKSVNNSVESQTEISSSGWWALKGGEQGSGRPAEWFQWVLDSIGINCTQMWSIIQTTASVSSVMSVLFRVPG